MASRVTLQTTWRNAQAPESPHGESALANQVQESNPWM
ncbi:hypothetical protein SynWH8103_02806 [Synechococcus sp. WH 8103]|nr:hypothetical protein SynWH8103_02806 [Synechococcus sp. WH 8103]